MKEQVVACASFGLDADIEVDGHTSQGSEFTSPPMLKRVITCESHVVEFVLPHVLAAGLAVRYQPRVVRSPAAHAPGVRSGRSCHTLTTRPWESPVRPAVGSGRSSHTRLQQPASRSASGRVLSPPYAVVRPNARSTGARGQRVARPASGAHPTRGRPVCCRHALVRARPVHQPARAAKAHCGGNPTATARHRQPSPSRSTSSRHPVAPTRSRARAATAPLATL